MEVIKEMDDMMIMNATDVRKNWSEVSDTVIREKPQFIKRTRDYMCLASTEFIQDILSAYTFTANKFIEPDGSITLSLNELDLVENADNEEKAKEIMAKSILEYSKDFYDEFSYWSAAPNRKKHIAYVFKALLLDDVKKIGECIVCQYGEN